MARFLVDPRFGDMLRRLRTERGLSYRDLAGHATYGKSYLHDLETGRKQPTPDTARRLDEILGAAGQLAALVTAAPVGAHAGAGTEEELDAWELARRVEISDVSGGTLERLEAAVDNLATRYASTPPHELLPVVRRHLSYVGRLLDARKTLDQHRRLLVAGGWLALLRATLDIDLRHRRAADTNLALATQLAEQTDHTEIAAWSLETRAWDALTDGDYLRALELSQHAQAVAPAGSSAFIQATAQEGRSWARMRDQKQTRRTLDRVDRLVATLPVPDQPEHHYRYDPDKALSYTATTLAWAGDPAAVDFIRAVIDDLDPTGDGGPRPRRAASARLDLGLALIGVGRPDEASAVATAAITSGRVVPSNWWRATEVLAGVEHTAPREATDLRDAYETFRPVRR
jgi:transcriptional regulator with XRE-family HTH domain